MFSYSSGGSSRSSIAMAIQPNDIRCLNRLVTVTDPGGAIYILAMQQLEFPGNQCTSDVGLSLSYSHDGTDR